MLGWDYEDRRHIEVILILLTIFRLGLIAI